jgi:hypothetical protein
VFAGVLALVFVVARHRNDIDLRIVPLSTPPPNWSIAAMGKTPILMLSFRARLAHRSPDSVEIVEAWLPGTACVSSFLPIVVAGPYDDPSMIHFGVRPIIARDGKALTKRVILVDQFGNEHRTRKSVTFAPFANNPSRWQRRTTEMLFLCWRNRYDRALCVIAHAGTQDLCQIGWNTFRLRRLG